MVQGNVSYDSMNHEKMTQLRFEKVKRIQQEIPATEIFGDPDGDLLIVWLGLNSRCYRGRGNPIDRCWLESCLHSPSFY